MGRLVLKRLKEQRCPWPAETLTSGKGGGWPMTHPDLSAWPGQTQASSPVPQSGHANPIVSLQGGRPWQSSCTPRLQGVYHSYVYGRVLSSWPGWYEGISWPSNRPRDLSPVLPSRTPHDCRVSAWRIRVPTECVCQVQRLLGMWPFQLVFQKLQAQIQVTQPGKKSRRQEAWVCTPSAPH